MTSRCFLYISKLFKILSHIPTSLPCEIHYFQQQQKEHKLLIWTLRELPDSAAAFNPVLITTNPSQGQSTVQECVHTRNTKYKYRKHLLHFEAEQLFPGLPNQLKTWLRGFAALQAGAMLVLWSLLGEIRSEAPHSPVRHKKGLQNIVPGLPSLPICL